MPDSIIHRPTFSPEAIKAIIEEDKELSVDQIDEKYNPEGGGVHPLFTRLDWRVEVAKEKTLFGYWIWVRAQIQRTSRQYPDLA